MKLRVNLADHGNEGRHVSEPYGEIDLTLSRRNLLSLLHKVDWKGSERTIQKYLDGVLLNVIVEDDDEHYGEDDAGVMHDETERFIESYGGSE
jgi:hypothetical protein